jgi:hypothetical protein
MPCTEQSRRPAKAETDAASRPTSESERVKKWREANRGRYNERERARMRRKRSGFIGIAYG